MSSANNASSQPGLALRTIRSCDSESMTSKGLIPTSRRGTASTHRSTPRPARYAISATLLVIAVLAVALILIRRGLEEIAQGLGTLHTALADVESNHLRPLEGAVKAINAQFDTILGALPGIARKAAVVAERRPR